MTTEDDIRRRREELKEDASARQRRAADPAYSIWVSASRNCCAVFMSKEARRI